MFWLDVATMGDEGWKGIRMVRVDIMQGPPTLEKGCSDRRSFHAVHVTICM